MAHFHRVTFEGQTRTSGKSYKERAWAYQEIIRALRTPKRGLGGNKREGVSYPIASMTLAAQSENYGGAQI